MNIRLKPDQILVKQQRDFGTKIELFVGEDDRLEAAKLMALPPELEINVLIETKEV